MSFSAAHRKAIRQAEEEKRNVGIVECPQGNFMAIPEPYLTTELPNLIHSGHKLIDIIKGG